MFHPLISKEDAEWAIAIIDYDNENIISKFENGEVSLNNTDYKQSKETMRICREYIMLPYDKVKHYKSFTQDMHKMRIITYKYLNQRLAPIAAFRSDKMGATAALKRTIQALIDSGEIQEVPLGQMEREFGTRQRCFSVKTKLED